MKTLLIGFLLMLGNFYLHGQYVNDFPLKDITSEYIQIVGTQKPLSTKVFIDIDFGQRDKLWVTKDTQIKDETGKPIVLNSMIDALNYLSKYDYEFVQAYAFSDGGQSVYHFLMHKKAHE